MPNSSIHDHENKFRGDYNLTNQKDDADDENQGDSDE